METVFVYLLLTDKLLLYMLIKTPKKYGVSLSCQTYANIQILENSVMISTKKQNPEIESIHTRFFLKKPELKAKASCLTSSKGNEPFQKRQH